MAVPCCSFTNSDITACTQYSKVHVECSGLYSKPCTQILTGKHRRGARTAFFCAAEQTGGSKGSFTWKKTVVGSAAMAPCTMSKDQATEFATRFCGHGGVWSPLDDSFCRYLSEKTANLDGLHNVRLYTLLAVVC